jgi:nitroreductase/NAD-dependent dihydropyrimidine dehydrogenase PreA subunit
MPEEMKQGAAMSLFSVDEEKCLRDGVCVAECPVGIIEIKSERSFPAPIQGAEELCINCGHCVAVCPHAAISLRTMRSEDCPPVRKELLPGVDQVEHFLVSRRSIRNYRDKPVERQTLLRIMQIAAYAPSGHNSQPVEWLVLEGHERLQHLASLVIDWMRRMMTEHPEIAQPMHFDRVVAAWENGSDRVLRGAPCLVAAHGPADFRATQASCIIALTYLDLAAAASGLGACWAGYFNAAAMMYEPLRDALALPAGNQCFGAMMVGYPKYPYHRIPKRRDLRVSWG